VLVEELRNLVILVPVSFICSQFLHKEDLNMNSIGIEFVFQIKAIEAFKKTNNYIPCAFAAARPPLRVWRPLRLLPIPCEEDGCGGAG
jgi:hypothetical protein